MAKRVNTATRPILKTLEETNLALPPKVILYNLNTRLEREVSKSTVQRALYGALEIGLVEVVEEDARYYRITEKGRAYLRGELDREDLEHDE